jgi:hypothetical protein
MLVADYEAVSCAVCTVWFGLTPTMVARRKDDHKGFFCPNGHSNVYEAPPPTIDPRDAELVRLRAETKDQAETIGCLKEEIASLTAELEVWKPRSAIEAPAKPVTASDA